MIDNRSILWYNMSIQEVIGLTTAERIDAILRDRKMSRRRLASESHVSPSTLQCALARGGDLSLDLLLPISSALNVSVEYLSGADEPPEMTADELQARWDGMSVDDKIRHYLAGLNTHGKLKVLDRLEELAELPKYQREI